jgi:hypothetical protein
MNESKPEHPTGDTVATDLNVEIDAMRKVYMAVLAVPPERRAEVLAWVSKRLEPQRAKQFVRDPQAAQANPVILHVGDPTPHEVAFTNDPRKYAHLMDPQDVQSATEKIQQLRPSLGLVNPGGGLTIAIGGGGTSGAGEPTATIKDIRGHHSPYAELGTLRQVITEVVRHKFGGVTPAPVAMVEFIRELRDGPNGPTRGFLNVIPDDTLEERITQLLEG